jgi:hypothetical protein
MNFSSKFTTIIHWRNFINFHPATLLITPSNYKYHLLFLHLQSSWEFSHILTTSFGKLSPLRKKKENNQHPTVVNILLSYFPSGSRGKCIVCSFIEPKALHNPQSLWHEKNKLREKLDIYKSQLFYSSDLKMWRISMQSYFFVTQQCLFSHVFLHPLEKHRFNCEWKQMHLEKKLPTKHSKALQHCILMRKHVNVRLNLLWDV